MLHKEMMLCGAGGENDTYTVTVGDAGSIYGYIIDSDNTRQGSISPSTFEGGIIDQLAFVQVPFATSATTDYGNITLNGLMCFVVFTTKTTTSTVKFTRLDTNASVTTVDCKAGSVNGKSFLAWASSSSVANSGLFFSNDVGKTIKVKIEKV